MPCQLGIKTSRDQNELPTNQLSSSQMVATSCLFLFSQWRMELMAVNMIHLLATLRTATSSQGKGTLNYQLEVGKGLSCRSGPSLPPPRQSRHFHFTYRKPSTHMINCRLPLFGLGPDSIFSLSSARFFSPYHHDAWILKTNFISRLHPQSPCIFPPFVHW